MTVKIKGSQKTQKSRLLFVLLSSSLFMTGCGGNSNSSATLKIVTDQEAIAKESHEKATPAEIIEQTRVMLEKRSIETALAREETAKALVDACAETLKAEENFREAESQISKESHEKAAPTEETEQINPIAYIAEKEVLIAQELAEIKKAETKLVTLDKEITSAMPEKRSFETALARDETAKALADACAKILEAEETFEKAKKLEKELNELGAKKTQRGLVFTLGGEFFKSGKPNLLPSSDHKLNKLAKFLKQIPNRKIVIEGHTDSAGNEFWNLRHSKRRAYAVRLALLEKGINTKRITYEGYGESKPIAENSTSMGKQQNRRVEIVVLNKKITTK
ncbi:MAG: OmpA family protein [Methylococcales bacterium]|nr:OmpA family protein [Methylococcales bacterium]